MIRERIARMMRMLMVDVCLCGLSIGACVIFFFGIVEYLEGRYELSHAIPPGLPGMLIYGGVFAVFLLCLLGAPLVLFTRLFWRCRKDGVWWTAIRLAIIAAALAPHWLLAGPAAVERAHEMRLRGFASRVRSQEADVMAIREWLKASRLPEGDLGYMQYSEELNPQFIRYLEDGSKVYVDYPSAVKPLIPIFARILEDGCLELEWRRRDVGAWGVIITPTEDFPQEKYRTRMAAGVYVVVHGKGEPMQYKEYMVQLSPGVYAWLRPQPEPPTPFPSEGVQRD